MTHKILLAVAGLTVGTIAALARAEHHTRLCQQIAREWVAERRTPNSP